MLFNWFKLNIITRDSQSFLHWSIKVIFVVYVVVANEHKDAAHHNCEGPNCPACGHYGSKDRHGSQNYAKWEKKMLHVPIVTVRFMERNVMHITRKKEKTEKAYVKSGTIVYSVARNIKSIGRSDKSVTMTTVETVKTMRTQWNIGASFNL